MFSFATKRQCYVFSDSLDLHYFFSYKLSRKEWYSQAPRDKAAMAFYLAGPSPKIQYLIRLVHATCIVAGGKLIVFMDWPVHLWYVSMVLVNLGVPCTTIMAQHTMSEREATVRKFNDLADRNKSSNNLVKNDIRISQLAASLS